MIKLGEITPVDQFLGCRHQTETMTGPDGDPVNVHIYDMKPFLEQCVQAYEELAGPGFKCTSADTPLVDEDGRDNPARTAAGDAFGLAGGFVCPCCTEAFPRSEFVEVLHMEKGAQVAKEMRTAQADKHIR